MLVPAQWQRIVCQIAHRETLDREAAADLQRRALLGQDPRQRIPELDVAVSGLRPGAEGLAGRSSAHTAGGRARKRISSPITRRTALGPVRGEQIGIGPRPPAAPRRACRAPRGSTRPCPRNSSKNASIETFASSAICGAVSLAVVIRERQAQRVLQAAARAHRPWPRGCGQRRPGRPAWELAHASRHALRDSARQSAPPPSSGSAASSPASPTAMSRLRARARARAARRHRAVRGPPAIARTTGCGRRAWPQERR